MIKNRTAQLIFLSSACTIGIIGALASLGLFTYQFKWDFYVYFTNLSNYFCIGIFFAELVQTIKKKEDSYVSACPVLKFIGMLAILLTFFMFNIVLAPKREPAANFSVNSTFLHIIIPILFVADWFLFYERKKVKVFYPFITLLFPFFYAVFIYTQAAILKFDASIPSFSGNGSLIYPYFFLNIETQGVLGVGKWFLIIFIGFMVIGYLLYGLDRISFKKKDK